MFMGRVGVKNSFNKILSSRLIQLLGPHPYLAPEH